MILVERRMGLYLAKRDHPAGADAGRRGRRNRRRPARSPGKAESSDEFGSLIDAFNRMAGEVAASRRRLERSAIDLEQKHQDVEARRRYVETILDRLGTGGVGRRGRAACTWNAAASSPLGVDARTGATGGLRSSDRRIRRWRSLPDDALRNREDPVRRKSRLLARGAKCTWRLGDAPAPRRGRERRHGHRAR